MKPQATGTKTWILGQSNKSEVSSSYEAKVILSLVNAEFERAMAGLDESTQLTGYQFGQRLIDPVIASILYSMPVRRRRERDETLISISPDGAVTIGDQTTDAPSIIRHSPAFDSFDYDPTLDVEAAELTSIAGYLTTVKGLLELGASMFGYRGKEIKADYEKVMNGRITELAPVFPWLYKAASQNPDILETLPADFVGHNEQGDLVFRLQQD